MQPESFPSQHFLNPLQPERLPCRSSTPKSSPSRPPPSRTASSSSSPSSRSRASGACSSSTRPTSPSSARPSSRTWPTTTPSSRSSASRSTASRPTRHFAHKAWHDTSDAIGKIQYALIGDPTGTITRNFDVMIEEEGLALRGTFVIDPDGVIKIVEIHDNGIGRDATELLRKVKAAQYVRQAPGRGLPGQVAGRRGDADARRSTWSARSDAPARPAARSAALRPATVRIRPEPPCSTPPSAQLRATSNA